MKFCPNCGQDQSVVVPQDQRILTEDVPVPPPPSGDQGADGHGRHLLRNVIVVVLIILGVLVAIIVKGAGESTSTSTTQDSASEKNEQEKKASTKPKPEPNAVEVGVGDTAELRDRTLYVNEVERNYVPPNPRVRRNKEGYEFVRTYITLTNTSNDTFNYNVNDFKVQDSTGVQNPHTTMTDIPYPISYGSLAPGGTLEGNLVFEVPLGDAGLKLIYQTSGPQRRTITMDL